MNPDSTHLMNHSIDFDRYDEVSVAHRLQTMAQVQRSSGAELKRDQSLYATFTAEGRPRVTSKWKFIQSS